MWCAKQGLGEPAKQQVTCSGPKTRQPTGGDIRTTTASPGTNMGMPDTFTKDNQVTVQMASCVGSPACSDTGAP